MLDNQFSQFIFRIIEMTLVNNCFRVVWESLSFWVTTNLIKFQNIFARERNILARNFLGRLVSLMCCNHMETSNWSRNDVDLFRMVCVLGWSNNRSNLNSIRHSLPHGSWNLASGRTQLGVFCNDGPLTNNAIHFPQKMHPKISKPWII